MQCVRRTKKNKMKQRTAEWLKNVNALDIKYHARQFKEPYRSTVAFCDWLEMVGYIRKDSELKIIDLCSGQGANICYMGERYPKCMFVGVDINPDIVTKGNSFFQKNGIKNCHLEVGDIYNLDSKYISGFDGIVSYQALLGFPEFEKPIQEMVRLKAPWIALTSLFYDGQVSCTVEVKRYDAALERFSRCFYSVYSLPIIQKYLRQKGYSDFQSAPFEIDIDLPKPKKRVMTTYTEKLENGHRLQMSGPVLMPWYFIGVRSKRV